MTDYALIALSPVLEGKGEYIRKERDKAVLLYQYLRKIGYEVTFLAPKNNHVPAETIELSKNTLLEELRKIKKKINDTGDEESKVVCYFSDSPIQVSRRLRIHYQEFLDVLSGKIDDATQMKKIFSTFIDAISSSSGIKINIPFLCDSLRELSGNSDRIWIDIQRITNLLDRPIKIKSIDLMDNELFTKFIHNVPFQERLDQRPLRKTFITKVVKKEDIRNKGFPISRDAIDKLCYFIRNNDQEFLHININSLRAFLHDLHYEHSLKKRTAYLQLRGNPTIQDIVFLSDIDKIIEEMECRTTMIIGSGNRSGIISQYFRSKDRITISSMGAGQKMEIDNFNIANGLLRANYEDLLKYKKFSPSNDMDIIRAFSTEMNRISKIEGASVQNPEIYYYRDYVEKRKIKPRIVPKPLTESDGVRVFDPLQGTYAIKKFHLRKTLPPHIPENNPEEPQPLKPPS